EADVEDVAVRDDVALPLQLLQAGAGRLRVGAETDKVVPAHDLAADEAARDVRVDRARGVEGGLALPQRPRAGLLLAGGEERDEAEPAGGPGGDRAHRRDASAAQGGPLAPANPRRPP